MNKDQEDWNLFWNTSLKDWRKKIVGALRRKIFRYEIIRFLKPVKNLDILEAGCGTSESLILVSNSSKSVTGLDSSIEAIKISNCNFIKNGASKSKYNFVLGDILKMPLIDSSFDLVFNAGVIEHFDDPKPIKEMIRVCRPRGRVVILVPGKISLYGLLYYLIFMFNFDKIYPWKKHTLFTKKSIIEHIKRTKIDGINIKISYSFRTLGTYVIAYISLI